MQQLLPNCGTARSSLNASIVAPAPLVVVAGGVGASPLAAAAAAAAPAVPPPPEKYYAATPICSKPVPLPLPLPLALPLPMPPTVGPAGSQSSGSLSLSSSNTAATTPTPTGGGGMAGVGGKPHHYNLDMSANFADINEEQANCQVQEFPRQSLVIVEKLGSGVFGELHLCETNVLK